MFIKIELSKDDLEKLVKDEIKRRIGDQPFNIEAFTLEVKSKQNWKSEWEDAQFRATYVATM